MGKYNEMDGIKIVTTKDGKHYGLLYGQKYYGSGVAVLFENGENKFFEEDEIDKELNFEKSREITDRLETPFLAFANAYDELETARHMFEKAQAELDKTYNRLIDEIAAIPKETVKEKILSKRSKCYE